MKSLHSLIYDYPVRQATKEKLMDVIIDVGFIALIVAFFAASAGLIRFCANLLGDKGGKS
jgi:hypothetical protein